MTRGPDLGLGTVPADERFVLRHGPVGIDAEYLAQTGRQVLSLVADRRIRALADGDEQPAVGSEDEPRTEMLVTVIGRRLPEDHRDVLERAGVGLAGLEAGARDAGSVAAAFPRLGEREDYRAALGDRKSTRLNSSHYCASRMPS